MLRRTLRPAVLALAALSAACSPMYVLRAGYEEARILSRRRPIERVVADPATDAETRRKLDLVLQARNFAEHGLGLSAGRSYTTYSWVDSDTLLLVVTGSRKDRFEAYTWWFPIVGRVPYKGYFAFDRARAEAARLEAAGFDSAVRPASAFSTLGWFNDPLLNTLLRYDDVGLVSTVIHELTHNTIYLSGQAGFNESWANFVGERGAIEFFCSRDGADAERCVQARDAWHDMRVYARFLTSFIDELNALYGREDLTSAEKIARREDVFDAARTRFTTDVDPQLRTRAYRGFPRRELNNATLIGSHLYYDRLDLFEAAFDAHGRDLAATLRAVEGAARAAPADPWAAVSRLVDERVAPPAAPG